MNYRRLDRASEGYRTMIALDHPVRFLGAGIVPTKRAGRQEVQVWFQDLEGHHEEGDHEVIVTALPPFVEPPDYAQYLCTIQDFSMGHTNEGLVPIPHGPLLVWYWINDGSADDKA